jgi:hypothetical protein
MGAPLDNMAGAVLAILDVLDKGQATAQQLRERARDFPGGLNMLPWIDLAEALHQVPPPAADPTFKAGTGMQPVAWEDCLWRPTP